MKKPKKTDTTQIDNKYSDEINQIYNDFISRLLMYADLADNDISIKDIEILFGNILYKTNNFIDNIIHDNLPKKK
jgi:hypothetical protein